MALLLGAVACRTTSPTATVKDDSVGSHASASVTAKAPEADDATVQQAFSIISAMDYIPFNEALDGCEYRALYMGMELIAQMGIAPTLIWVESVGSKSLLNVRALPVTTLPSPQFQPDESGVYATWQFHVAIGFRQHGTWTMIDPSLATAPLPLADWLQLAGATPALRSQLHVHAEPWNANGNSDPVGPHPTLTQVDQDHSIASLDQLPVLMTNSTLSDAYGQMAVRLLDSPNFGWSPAAKAQIDAAHAKLGQRTLSLRDALSTAGILKAADADDAVLTQASLDASEDDVKEGEPDLPIKIGGH